MGLNRVLENHFTREGTYAKNSRKTGRAETRKID